MGKEKEDNKEVRDRGKKTGSVPMQKFYSSKRKTKLGKNHYWQAYYIFNTLLVALYPLHRLGGLTGPGLYKKDWLGYSREKTIVATFVLLSALRYRKFCNVQHAVVSIIFYAKFCVLALYFIIAAKFFIVYGFVIIASWFMISIPFSRGPHNFKKIENYEDFDSYVLNLKPGKKLKKSKNKGRVEKDYKKVKMCFVEFWAPFAETCLYTRSIWAEFSRKYTTNNLKFAEVDASKNKEIAEDYFINTSGFSRQLPTLILFEDGKEVSRFPAINKEGKVGKVLKYDKHLLEKYFDLENRFLETMNL